MNRVPGAPSSAAAGYFQPLLLICSIGGRSFAAVQLLQEKGYTEVYNLDGGLQAWSRASLPLQTTK